MPAVKPTPLRDSRLQLLLERAEREPRSVENLLALASTWNARCMSEEAVATCEQLLALAPDDGRVWFEAIVARSFAGDAALKSFQPRVSQALAEHPEAAWAHRNLGLLAYYRDRDDDTRRACARALELDPRDSRAHEVLAYLAYTVGDLDGAVESGIKAVELDPTNHRALHWLGECYAKLDAADQAIRYLHRCLQLDDCYFFALESLGTIYMASPSTHAEALQCFARIFAVNPRHFPAHFRLADTLIQTGRLAEAAGEVETVLRLEPDASGEADAHQYLGLIDLLQGQHAAAREQFEQALRLDEHFAAAHHYLGVLAEQEGRVEDAEVAYRRAIDCDAEYALPQVRLGYLCFDRKQFANAKRHFEAAISIDEEDYMAWLGLSEIARWRKDHDEQLRACLRALDLAPDDSNVRNQLGTAHDALGHDNDARHEYEEALRLDPSNRQAANNLGYLLERILKNAPPAKAPSLTAAAVEAWKRRLLICRDQKASTRGARNHLEKLGVSGSQIDDWLDRGRVES